MLQVLIKGQESLQKGQDTFKKELVALQTGQNELQKRTY